MKSLAGKILESNNRANGGYQRRGIRRVSRFNVNEESEEEKTFRHNQDHANGKLYLNVAKSRYSDLDWKEDKLALNNEIQMVYKCFDRLAAREDLSSKDAYKDVANLDLYLSRVAELISNYREMTQDLLHGEH